MNKKAFTLAEVLITMTVIGVVCILSIPSLVMSAGDTANAVAFKKNYSIFKKVFSFYKQKNGDIKEIFKGNGSAVDDEESLKKILPYLEIYKFCGSDKGCWYDTKLRYQGGSTVSDNFDTDINGNYAKAILTDGAMILVNDFAGNCISNIGDGPLSKTCGYIDIDINGEKAPNQMGKDYFSIWVTERGTFPVGILNDGNLCDKNGNNRATSIGCSKEALLKKSIN